MAKTYRIKKQKPAMPATDYLNALNDEQREVVTAEMGPLLVLAGAGTGKTRALTTRVVHMLRQGIPSREYCPCYFYQPCSPRDGGPRRRIVWFCEPPPYVRYFSPYCQ